MMYNIIGSILLIISIIIWVNGFISLKHDYQKNKDECSPTTNYKLWLSLIISGIGAVILINSI